MGQIVTWLRSSLCVAGFALLAIVGLALLAVVAVAMRPLLIVGLFVTGLACAALCYFSPGFREWFRTAGEWQIGYKGLRLVTDVAVHPGHSWARIAPEDVTVGADDLVQAALGPVEHVELPPVGSRVEQGDRLFSLRRGDRSVEVRAPISGTVASRNEALVDRPELVNQGPFDQGWAVRLRVGNVGKERQLLREGKQAREWFRKEIDRLIGTVLAGEAPTSAAADGGTVVRDLYRHIDESTWKKLTEAFFDVAPTASTGA